MNNSSDTTDGDFTFQQDEVTAIKPKNERHQRNLIPTSPIDNSSEEHDLHCLSEFFTDPEKLALEETDAVISIEGNTFVVLPNKYIDGETLFRSVAQAVLDDERMHYKIRDKVVDYIISEQGWDELGYHIVPFYTNFIDEMKHGNRYYGRRKEEFYQRVYRHYFVNEAIEGSLIELAGASLLYDFCYTCVFLQFEEQEQPKGIALFRIIHSLKDDGGQHTRDNYKPHYHFLRVGHSPSDWVWSLLVPYTTPERKISVEDDDNEIPCTYISPGYCIGGLWNVYGLNWNHKASIKKRLPTNFFRWKTGITAIVTNSGKLLGGYTTLGNDLFANLCWLLNGNLKNYSLLRNSATQSSSKYLDRLLNHPSKMNLKEKEFEKTYEASKNPCNKVSSIGTLKDLQKVSNVCKFGFVVIGINERGELYNLTKCTYKQNSKNIFYFLVRTKKGEITRWCALRDMTNLYSPTRTTKDEITSLTQKCVGPAQDNDNFGNISSKVMAMAGSNDSRTLRKTTWSATKTVSQILSRCQSLIMTVTDRNKVHGTKNTANTTGKGQCT